MGGDTLNGAAGDDWLDAGDGNDTLIGGAGTDTASYAGGGAVSINLLTSENGGDAAGDVFIDIEVFLGSSGADTFAGDDRGNTFNGGGGVDAIDYSGSLEAVNVNLTTGAVSGGDAQDDMLISVEKIIGSGADDTLASSTSGHVLAGGYGDDVYIVGSAGVVLLENEDDGVDVVQTNLASFTLGSANIENIVFTGSGAFAGTGSAGDNTITGGASGDTLNGAAGNDTLNGGDGDDILIGGAGADHLVGGVGNDIARYAAAVIIDMSTGDHGGDAAGDTFDGIELIQGSASGDTFISGEGADRFDGAGGTDTLSYAGSANAVNVNLTTNVVSGGDAQGDVVSNFEKVIGSSGDDILASSTNGHILAGGWGGDTYLVGASGVIVQEDADGGNDTIQVTLASFTLTTLNVENITYAGSGTFNGVGSGDANTITGGAGADTLSGGGGDDTLVGGDGDDVLIGGAGADHLIGGAGVDTASYADSTVGLTFDLNLGEVGGGDTFDGIERILGSNFADIFIGGGDADHIDGGVGIDLVSYQSSGSGLTVDMTNPSASTGFAAGDSYAATEIMWGSAYDDTIIGDGSANTFIGGDGGDTINGGAGADSVWYVLSGSGVAVNLATGANSTGDTLISIEGLLGSQFDDILIGDDGANFLEGSSGGDKIYGGAGNDTIFGDRDGTKGTGAFDVPSTGAGSDELHGGDGDDRIVMSGNDASSVAWGDAGADTFTVFSGEAHGGDGSDTFSAHFNGYHIFGEAGVDRFNLFDGSVADGGDDGDIYSVTSRSGAHIRDTGTFGEDGITLSDFRSSQGPVASTRVGNDLWLSTTGSFDPNTSVVVENYYTTSFIEHFHYADGISFFV